MTKDVQMVIRIEPELRESFVESAQLENRPAAQVLREFMRAYVDQVHHKRGASKRGASIAANDVISEYERQSRAKSVSFARASIGLEGFSPSAEDEALALRFVKGDINIEAAIKAVHESVRDR
jgi:hypothetical protein